MKRLQTLDWSKFSRNTATFFAPVALIYLVALQGNLADGFSLQDFVPTQVVIGSMVLYVVNVAVDFCRKLMAAPSS